MAEPAGTDPRNDRFASIKAALLPEGTLIGRYRLGAPIGAGKASTVYKAFDTMLKREVALKLLRAKDVETKLRFQREAKLSSGLHHPNVVGIFDIGEYDGSPYIVMELVAGGSIAQLVKRRGPLSPDNVVRVGVQLCRALRHLHETGIVHRDVNPGNIFCAADGAVKLGDLGLARNDGGENESAALTRVGAILGTPQFASPEMCTGGRVGPPSDVYSLGLTLYFLLTGEIPFDGRNLPEVLYRQCSEPLPDLRVKLPGCPPSLIAAIEHATTKDPGGRPASAQDLSNELKSVLSMPGTEHSMGGASTSVGSMAAARNDPARVEMTWPNAPAVPAGRVPGPGGQRPGFSARGIPGVQGSSVGGLPAITGMEGDPGHHGQGVMPGMPRAGASGGSKGPLIAVLATVVLLAGGAFAAWKLGLIKLGGESPATKDESTKDGKPGKDEVAVKPGNKDGTTVKKPGGAEGLYDRLGGEKGIGAIVDDLCIRTIRNPKVDFSRSGRIQYDLQKTQDLLKLWFCKMAGGPQTYTGRSMKDSHVGLRITESEFDAFVEDTVWALDKHGVSADDRAVIVGKLQATKADIVENRPTDLTNSIGMKFRFVQAGSFEMGSPPVEAGRRDDEDVHSVRLTKDYYIGTYEVTQEEYETVMKENPSESKGPRRPVEKVSWQDAVKFCELLSGRAEEIRAGRKYRLPTEAEWEYACRAGTKTAFAGGDSLSEDEALFGQKTGPTKVVGSYKANAWGLFDTHGNVAEWVADVYKDDYYAESPSQDPKGPTDGNRRVVRGGSWLTQAKYCRSAARFDYRADDKLAFVGFRVVCEQN